MRRFSGAIWVVRHPPPSAASYPRTRLGEVIRWASPKKVDGILRHDEVEAALYRGGPTELRPAFQPDFAPIFAELAGKSHRAIAAELNARQAPTPAGGQWHAVTGCWRWQRGGCSATDRPARPQVHRTAVWSRRPIRSCAAVSDRRRMLGRQ